MKFHIRLPCLVDKVKIDWARRSHGIEVVDHRLVFDAACYGTNKFDISTRTYRLRLASMRMRNKFRRRNHSWEEECKIS